MRTAKKLNPTPLCLLVGLGLLVAASIATAAIWTEVGDADDLPSSAQETIGVGELALIEGNITDATDVDMYCIRVDDPQLFYAGTTCSDFGQKDIWLFDALGFPVAAADGCSLGFTNLTDQFVTSAGIYYVAISATDDEAQSSGGPLWSPATDPAETAPDGAGVGAPIANWDGTGSAPADPFYSIRITGGSFCDSPVPAETTAWGRVKARF